MGSTVFLFVFELVGTHCGSISMSAVLMAKKCFHVFFTPKRTVLYNDVWAQYS